MRYLLPKLKLWVSTEPVGHQKETRATDVAILRCSGEPMRERRRRGTGIQLMTLNSIGNAAKAKRKQYHPYWTCL